MKKLYIMCGVAFSGKSTLSRKIAEYKKAVLIAQDKLWFEKKEEWNLDLDNDEDWDKILQLSKEKVREVLMKNESVVFDDISLKYSDREALRDMAKECEAETVVVYLDTPREIQEERRIKNLKTKERHDVPDHILEWGLNELQIPQENENVVVFKSTDSVEEWLDAL